MPTSMRCGETLAQAEETIEGARSPRLSLSFRPILAATEVMAWARAEANLAETKRVRGQAMLGATLNPANRGSQRLRVAAAQDTVADQRLWTALAAATGARGNTTALVGTSEQVAESLFAYYDLAVTTFLIRGFDPLEGAGQHGPSFCRSCGRKWPGGRGNKR